MSHRPTSLLAFDTATERMSIALGIGEQAWYHEGEGGAQASAALIPAILRLLGEAGVGVADLDAIAFGRGPGAFTGLRTACSVAQGLAFGAARPVLAMDTLLAVAQDARSAEGVEDVWVAMDARMGEIYGAHYRVVDAAWTVADAPALWTLDALQARWRGAAPACVAGSALAAFGERLDTGAAQRVPDARPRPAALLELARGQWGRGEAVDATLALPLYLRNKVALTTIEREAVRAAKA